LATAKVQDRLRNAALGIARSEVGALGASCLVLLITAATMISAQQADISFSADRALARLMEGNRRYVRHKEQHPDESVGRRKELEGSQHPFAVILSCSDSRVPPELIFDQGLGDLFVIRVAGNVAANDELGSIEYAAEHLHTKLIMVLGHEKCGAITAAVEGAAEAGHLKYLISAIQPSVEESRNLPGDKIHNCVLANARRVARQLRESEPVLKELIQKDGVKVVAADYALDSGLVMVLDDAHR
jgi:carbonic anhydrase